MTDKEKVEKLQAKIMWAFRCEREAATALRDLTAITEDGDFDWMGIATAERLRLSRVLTRKLQRVLNARDELADVFNEVVK